MKLIESNVEYIPQAEGLEGIYKQIELAGRTAYKSENKIVDVVNIDIDELPVGMNIEDIPSYKDNPSQCISFLKEHNIEYKLISSADKFVDMLIRNKHYAALECGTVYLAMPITTHYSDCSNIYMDSPYCKVNESKGFVFKDIFGNTVDCWCITTNFRFIQENKNILWQDIKELLCPPSMFHEKRYTFKFTCDRGISHELVRHRTFSFLQESTRYCNYMLDKFGNQVTFIIPSWITATDKRRELLLKGDWQGDIWNYAEDTFFELLDDAERAYFTLLDNKYTPQEARAVLPNALKTELIMTGFSSDWRDLLDLRYFEKTGKVHPDMAQLMQKLAALMHVTGIWDDIMKYPSKFE